MVKRVEKGVGLLEEHSLSDPLPAYGLCAGGWSPRFLRPGSLAVLTAFGSLVMLKILFLVGVGKKRTYVLPNERIA